MNMPQFMIGTFQNKNYHELFGVVDAAVRAGFTGFDTAPSYGTEEQLGKAVQECANRYNLKRTDFYISDKVDAWQMREGNGNVETYVSKAVSMMNVQYLDLLLIHWPIAEYFPQTWNCMLQLKEKNIVKEIGICNARVRHLKEWDEKGIYPSAIQIERHPLRTCEAEIRYCKDHDIKVLSYSPLCRMHIDIRNNKVLKEIAKKYGKNIGQIVLRWQIDTGCCPVFMSKKATRILENIDILNFHLEYPEISAINQLNQNYKIFLESWGCPGF